MVDYKTTQMDIKLAEIFDGEYVRNSDSIHWDGGIVYDNLEQERYKRVIVYPLSQYHFPSNSVGRLFILILLDEISGILERKWNMKRVLCFMSMTLQCHLKLRELLILGVE